MNDLRPQLSITTHLPPDNAYAIKRSTRNSPSSSSSSPSSLGSTPTSFSPPDLLSDHDPPKYEPMFDYLRSRPQPPFPPSPSFPRQSPPHRPHRPCPGPVPTSAVAIPYRDNPDGPFVVTIATDTDGDVDADAGQPPPPSYEDLYWQQEADARSLMRQFDMDSSPAEQTEELVKWVVAMLLICLTVAAVGTAFNWGRD
ncbi:uncharacterized protein L3040_005106 [Drepanopeziza brunnea f. sp. 'multigermtubi']|nr:hypothetical protein L3040_005106 [Drepanopeziza brunnea f. sp. 'multigermtubi']